MDQANEERLPDFLLGPTVTAWGRIARYVSPIETCNDCSMNVANSSRVSVGMRSRSSVHSRTQRWSA